MQLNKMNDLELSRLVWLKTPGSPGAVLQKASPSHPIAVALLGPCNSLTKIRCCNLWNTGSQNEEEGASGATERFRKFMHFSIKKTPFILKNGLYFDKRYGKCNHAEVK